MIAGNMCDAPLVANANFSDIVVQPKYHYFGHFSKWVEPGAVRVSSSVVGSYGFQQVCGLAVCVCVCVCVCVSACGVCMCVCARLCVYLVFDQHVSGFTPFADP